MTDRLWESHPDLYGEIQGLRLQLQWGAEKIEQLVDQCAGLNRKCQELEAMLAQRKAEA